MGQIYPGHGMLVWHVDYDQQVFYNNKVNNTKDHQYVDLIEADNIQDYPIGVDGDITNIRRAPAREIPSSRLKRMCVRLVLKQRPPWFHG